MMTTGDVPGAQSSPTAEPRPAPGAAPEAKAEVGGVGLPTGAPTTAGAGDSGSGRPGPARIVRAGTVDYLEAWARQRDLHQAVVDGRAPDTVLLLEHPSVYTAGKRTEAWDRPVDGTPVVDVDRGGKITWHGPGQLVGYPIVRLTEPVDVVAYVRRVEQVLIDVCADLGVSATRIDGRSGAWVPADDRGPDRKIGALGIRVSRGVTLHGFSLNCDCDLTYFDRIVPCGIRDASVTSLSAELTAAGSPGVTVAEVLPAVERRLRALFD